MTSWTTTMSLSLFMLWPVTGAQTPASFSLRISPEQQTVKIGDPVNIDVAFTNNLGHETMMVKDDYPEERYFVEVRDDAGVRQKMTARYTLHARMVGKQVGKDKPSHNALPRREDGTAYIEVNTGHHGPVQPVKQGAEVRETVHLKRLYLLDKAGTYHVQLEVNDPVTKATIASNVAIVVVTN